MLRTAIAGALGALISFHSGAETAPDVAQQVSSPSPWVATDGAVIDFTVLRKGKPFGQHVLTFDRDENGALTVTTDVDLQVKFGPITAFRYRLDSIETWVDGQLNSLNGRSNSDGRKANVTGNLVNAGFQVDSTEYNGVLPGTVIPSSHWNRMQVYQDRMLSTETGEVLDIEVETIGPDTVMVDGEEVEATHYRLSSDLTVDLWYDQQSRWVKLAFEVRGQDIEYVLNALY
ncbi:MAG: DUF6134 family protein [Pseudomonadota bacterium]